MKISQLDWGDWFLALMNAVIGGGATSVTGWLTTVGAKAAGMNVPSMNLNTLWIYWLTGSVGALFFYLKQSPLPKVISETTTTTTLTTKEVVKQDPTPQSEHPDQPKP